MIFVEVKVIDEVVDPEGSSGRRNAGIKKINKKINKYINGEKKKRKKRNRNEEVEEEKEKCRNEHAVFLMHVN